MFKKKYRYLIIAGMTICIILGNGFTSNASTEYVVKKGDSLWKIAKTYLGSGTLYGKIYDANKNIIKNPNRISIGWKIIIPDKTNIQSGSQQNIKQNPQENIQQEGQQDLQPPRVENPVKTYDSLDAMNQAAGTVLQHPGVMGVSNEHFSVITGEDIIAQYSYDIAGISYTLRCSPTSLSDISGVYINGKLAYEDRDIPDDIDYIYSDDYYLARWFRVEGQFVLSAKPYNGYTEENFRTVAKETQMVNAIQQEAGDVEFFDPYALEGSYADRISQRASMDITYNEYENIVYDEK